eukprot:scaffold233065_cov36-Tisochrysis_lutea.AAC.2
MESGHWPLGRYSQGAACASCAPLSSTALQGSSQDTPQTQAPFQSREAIFAKLVGMLACESGAWPAVHMHMRT